MDDYYRTWYRCSQSFWNVAQARAKAPLRTCGGHYYQVLRTSVLYNILNHVVPQMDNLRREF